MEKNDLLGLMQEGNYDRNFAKTAAETAIAQTNSPDSGEST